MILDRQPSLGNRQSARRACLPRTLGIGANAAIFRLIDQLLLRKLPIRAPEALVMLHQEGANMGSNMGSRMHSYPLYQDFQQKAVPLAEVLCRRLVPASVSVKNQTERVEVELVSGNYFSMLGVKPAVGRVQLARGRPGLQRPSCCRASSACCRH